MTGSSSARPLPSIVKSRLNRIAHAAALRHEAEVRETALQALAALAANGAGLAELNAHLDQLDPTSDNPLPEHQQKATHV